MKVSWLMFFWVSVLVLAAGIALSSGTAVLGGCAGVLMAVYTMEDVHE